MKIGTTTWKVVVLGAAVCATVLMSGCAHKTYDPAWATRPYPHELHTTHVVDMQVFRRDTSIQIVNSTARSYSDFDLWINQRYVQHVDSMPAGSTIELSLWDFHDDFGDAFYAGGFFRSYEATPVRLVEIQPGGDQKMVGLVTIRAEDIFVKPEPGRER
jgi:hypothetical protein